MSNGRRKHRPAFKVNVAIEAEKGRVEDCSPMVVTLTTHPPRP